MEGLAAVQLEDQQTSSKENSGSIGEVLGCQSSAYVDEANKKLTGDSETLIFTLSEHEFDNPGKNDELDNPAIKVLMDQNKFQDNFHVEFRSDLPAFTDKQNSMSSTEIELMDFSSRTFTDKQNSMGSTEIELLDFNPNPGFSNLRSQSNFSLLDMSASYIDSLIGTLETPNPPSLECLEESSTVEKQGKENGKCHMSQTSFTNGSIVQCKVQDEVNAQHGKGTDFESVYKNLDSKHEEQLNNRCNKSSYSVLRSGAGVMQHTEKSCPEELKSTSQPLELDQDPEDDKCPSVFYVSCMASNTNSSLDYSSLYDHPALCTIEEKSYAGDSQEYHLGLTTTTKESNDIQVLMSAEVTNQQEDGEKLHTNSKTENMKSVLDAEKQLNVSCNDSSCGPDQRKPQVTEGMRKNLEVELESGCVSANHSDLHLTPNCGTMIIQSSANMRHNEVTSSSSQLLRKEHQHMQGLSNITSISTTNNSLDNDLKLSALSEEEGQGFQNSLSANDVKVEDITSVSDIFQHSILQGKDMITSQNDSQLQNEQNFSMKEEDHESECDMSISSFGDDDLTGSEISPIVDRDLSSEAVQGSISTHAIIDNTFSLPDFHTRHHSSYSLDELSSSVLPTTNTGRETQIKAGFPTSYNVQFVEACNGKLNPLTQSDSYNNSEKHQHADYARHCDLDHSCSARNSSNQKASAALKGEESGMPEDRISRRDCRFLSHIAQQRIVASTGSYKVCSLSSPEAQSHNQGDSLCSFENTKVDLLPALGTLQHIQSQGTVSASEHFYVSATDRVQSPANHAILHNNGQGTMSDCTRMSVLNPARECSHETALTSPSSFSQRMQHVNLNPSTHLLYGDYPDSGIFTNFSTKHTEKDQTPSFSFDRDIQHHGQKVVEEQRTVVVSGSSLDPSQEELCSLYFENRARSGGGEIQKNGVKWDNEKKCFFIVFEDSQDAKNVVSRQHILSKCTLTVQLCSEHSRDNKVSDSAKSEPKVQSPNNYFKDRIQVSGVPTETTNDCLLNYLENLTNITVQKVLTDSRDSSERIVIMDSSDEELDVSKLHRLCQENPVAPNVQLTFSKIPHAAAVLVSGLNPKTADDAVRFFFANKKRNHGGPLERIERCKDKSRAIIHFKNTEDAESVVKKQSHMLDEHELRVSIWDKCDTSELFTKPETRRHAEFIDVQTVSLTPVPSGRILNKNYSSESPPEQAFDHSGHYSVSASKFPQSINDRHQSRSLHTSLETASIQLGAYPVKIPRISPSPPSHSSHALFQHPTKLPAKECNFPENPQAGKWPGQCKSNSSLIDDSQFKFKTERKNHPEKPAAQKEGIPSQACLDGKQTCYDSAIQTKQIDIEIGAAAIRNITADGEKLRKLTSCLKSYGGKFNWKKPDHIHIKCLIENPPSHWEKQVTDQVHRFVNDVTEQTTTSEVPGLCNAVSTSRFSQTLESPLVNKQLETSILTEISADGPLNVGKPADSAVSTVKGTLQRDSMLANEDTSISGSRHMQEETIPKLKTCQLKILMLPHLLEKLQSHYPGLEIYVYEDKKEAMIRGPEGLMKKSFPELLSFITHIREHKVHLNSSLVKMFEKVDTKEWVQEKLIDESGYLCHWEISDDDIILYGHNADLITLENDFKRAFLNSKLCLEDKELSTLRSPAWKVFEERIQEERKGYPAPLFLPKGNDIIIVDAPSTISETRYKVTKYLAENKSEVKNLDVHPNRSKFLQLYNNDEMKTLSSNADDVGVSVTCNPNGIMAKGPKECLADVVGTVKELVSRIKEDQMTFKKPGEAKYLTGDKGQAVLNQIGSVTKCFITTDGSGSSSQGIKVLAEVRMGPEQILQIVQGDITQCKVDAIVNAANGELDHAGGVAAAIVKAGGKSIQKESNELIEKYGPLSEGNLMVTKAGALPCSHILHAVGPTWKGGNRGEEELLRKTISTTLEKARTMQLTSLAMPAISSGIFGYPVQKATLTIMHTIKEHMDKVQDDSLKLLMLIDVSSEPLQGFLEAGKILYGKHLKVKEMPSSFSSRGGHGNRHSSERQKDHRNDSSRSHSGHVDDHKPHAPIRVISGEIAKSRHDKSQYNKELEVLVVSHLVNVCYKLYGHQWIKAVEKGTGISNFVVRMYHLIEFLPENNDGRGSAAIVPDSWLVPGTNQCRWPKTKFGTSGLIRQKKEPGPAWGIHPYVRIKHSSASLEHMEMLLDQFMEKSDLDTDLDTLPNSEAGNVHKRKRVATKPWSPQRENYPSPAIPDIQRRDSNSQPLGEPKTNRMPTTSQHRSRSPIQRLPAPPPRFQSRDRTQIGQRSSSITETSIRKRFPEASDKILDGHVSKWFSDSVDRMPGGRNERQNNKRKETLVQAEEIEEIIE